MPQPLAPGTTVGGYRIEDEIGRGGMGIVYVAEQLALGRRVALKVIAPELGDDEDFRARFVREARTAASIDHPGVIPVHDAGEADGVLFLAMRLVPGTDLRTLLASEGEVGPERTIAVLAPVADALDAAHAAGLIHRDVKPANILIERPGTPGQRVYLTDFGLTKRLSSRSRVTRTGFVLGTVDYASPEQQQGREVTAAADVYSLGCVAFECLIGRPPFGGDTDASVIAAHLMEPPPRPSEVVAGLPPAVDSVIAVAMAKDPVARFDSCGALVAALSGALEGVAPREPVARTKALPIAPPPPVPVPARTTGVLPRSPGAPSSGLDQPDGEAAPALLRECPHCREAMRRDARVCPHCRRESDALDVPDRRMVDDGTGRPHARPQRGDAGLGAADAPAGRRPAPVGRRPPGCRRATAGGRERDLEGDQLAPVGRRLCGQASTDARPSHAEPGRGARVGGPAAGAGRQGRGRGGRRRRDLVIRSPRPVSATGGGLAGRSSPSTSGGAFPGPRSTSDGGRAPGAPAPSPAARLRSSHARRRPR
jgi:protein kinase-like protein